MNNTMIQPTGFPHPKDRRSLLFRLFQVLVMGVWEKRETELFLSLIKPEMTILDVGAHVGYYSLLAAKRVAQVYAFEPDPESFELLTRSVNVNGYTNVKCF